MHSILVCLQDMLQAENASQKYIQQMFRRQQPQAPAEKPSSQPKGTYFCWRMMPALLCRYSLCMV